MNPLLTIVTVCRDSLPDLVMTIESVNGQHQDLLNRVEHILVLGKDFSTASRADLPLRIPTLILSDSNKGVYPAMNEGASRASGKYILFLNAGDTLHGRLRGATISLLVSTLEKESASCIASTVEYRPVCISHRKKGTRRPVLITPKISMLPASTWPHPGLLWNRLDFTRSGGYNECYKYVGDRELLLRYYMDQRELRTLPHIVLSTYNSSDSSMSASLRAITEDIKLTMKIGLLPSWGDIIELCKRIARIPRKAIKSI
jgi:hypothetical protein